MPIDLYTGQPGNGKTATMMKRLLDESAKAERPLFAAGIDGLSPGLATVLDDPREWNKVDREAAGDCRCSASLDPHAHVVPDGALIFVDEAWKWFGHLQDASRQATPAHVLHLAEHRHRGIDFVWTTQMPNQLFPFARGLIATHTHVVRRFGTAFLDLYTWGELQDDVKSPGKREAAQKTTTTLPKETFDKYKSATLHTIKRKIPLRIYAMPAVLFAAVACGWFAFNYFKPDAIADRLSEQGAPAATAAGAPAASDGQRSAGTYQTAEDYVRHFTPRITAAPWTAPAFDGREPVSEPTAVCGRIHGGKCTCLTEQGTAYNLGQAQCVAIVEQGGVYNPFKEPDRERRGERTNRGEDRLVERVQAMPEVETTAKRLFPDETAPKAAESNAAGQFRGG